MAPDGVHLEILGVGKSFGSTRALDDVSVAITAGSVHAFVGENGAGKSTLGKIVAGVFPPDQGELVAARRAGRVPVAPRGAERGIALVAQEVALVPQRTVAENVFLGTEPRRARLRPAAARCASGSSAWSPTPASTSPADARRRHRCRSRSSSRSRSCGRSPATPSSSCFDEPTAALSATEVQRFHEIVRGLAAGGRTVILVSHFLGEVLALADTITVLRDGRVVQTGPAADETEDTLVAAMLGRSVEPDLPAEAAAAPPTHRWRSTVRDADRRRRRRARRCEVRAGEIVALAGLVGAGRSELARAIFGASPVTAGEMLGRDRRASRGTPRARIRRQRRDHPRVAQGRRPAASAGRSARTSASPACRRSAGSASCAGGVEATRARDALAQGRRGRATSRPPRSTLSGGNQQKLMFARALLGRPAVLIADEPTRGVDVGAKRDIYELLVELAAGGVAILLISSEIEEVLGLAHRVARDARRPGRRRARRATQMTEEAILAASFGRAASAA